uniref:Uncharacterized protein n=1 Tax=Caenorhabditis japonica TaxID=281687 RepID=A0A8R1EKQ7_CAEJA
MKNTIEQNTCTVIYLFSPTWLISASPSVDFAPIYSIDAVVLDELLREIVDSSMSDLRHRLQEAVFATAFRRRIQQHATSSVTPSKDKEISAIDRLLDDYIKPQKLSLALETFTTTPRPVQLVTIDDVAFAEGSGDPYNSLPGRMFDDAYKESMSSAAASSSPKLPRVPVWIAILVSAACVLTFFLLIGTVVYFISHKRSQKVQNFGLRRRRMMPDPMTVQSLCHTTSPCHIRTIPISSNFSNSSRPTSCILEQDRAASSIWAQP